MVDHQALIQKFGRALNEADAQLLGELMADDYVEEYPQSGEVIRGRHNILAILQNYPGRTSDMSLGMVDTLSVRGFDSYKPVAPTFALVRVEGAGDNGVSTVRATYPDGSHWWVVSIYRLRGGRIAHMRTFFAPDFPAPEWRAQWVEKPPR
jgi:hypothetical protein